jgi:KipI family sensor histidine kinase inhibitor
MRLLPYGDRAVLVELDETAGDPTPVELHGALHAVDQSFDGPAYEEAIPAARTVLVRHSPTRIGRRRAQAAITTAITTAMTSAIGPPAAAARPTAVPTLVHLSVRYDGLDLDAVARVANCSVEAVVQRHTAVEYTVAFCGFAPGFAYLTGLDPVLQQPRLPSPRTHVPSGAVAIAGPYTAAYPRPSPGGWQLLGRTDALLWDVDRPEPALLAPGTRVRFHPTNASGAEAAP